MGSTPTSRTPRTPSCAAGRRQARGAGLMARTVDLKVKYEVELTVIRPGDTALVRLPRDTTSAQAQELTARLKERLPGVELLLISGVDGIDIYRPDDEAGGPDGGERTGAEGPGEAAEIGRAHV